MTSKLVQCLQELPRLYTTQENHQDFIICVQTKLAPIALSCIILSFWVPEVFCKVLVPTGTS